MQSIPIVTITGKTKDIISDETGHTQCICTFTVDKDVYQWEARAVSGREEPKRGDGKLVETGLNLKANETGQVIVDYWELTQGDGLYTISIYAQDFDGNWSDGGYSLIGRFQRYNTGLTYNSRVMYNSGEWVDEYAETYNKGLTYNSEYKYNQRKDGD